MSAEPHRDLSQGERGRAIVTYHGKSPHASPETLRALAGIIVLKAPIASGTEQFIGLRDDVLSEPVDGRD